MGKGIDTTCLNYYRTKLLSANTYYIYLDFVIIWKLYDVKMLQVVEIYVHWRQVHPVPLIYPSHGYWTSGDTTNQNIKTHCIGLLIPEYSGFRIREANLNTWGCAKVFYRRNPVHKNGIESQTATETWNETHVLYFCSHCDCLWTQWWPEVTLLTWINLNPSM